MTHHARLNCPARAVLLAGLIFFLSAFSFPRRKDAMPRQDNTPGTVRASPETPSISTQAPTLTPAYTPVETITVEPTPSPVSCTPISYGGRRKGDCPCRRLLWPTAGEPNRLFLEDVSKIEKELIDVCVLGEPPRMRFPRLGRHPELVNRLSSQGHLLCSNGRSDLAYTESDLPSIDKN